MPGHPVDGHAAPRGGVGTNRLRLIQIPGCGAASTHATAPRFTYPTNPTRECKERKGPDQPMTSLACPSCNSSNVKTYSRNGTPLASECWDCSNSWDEGTGYQAYLDERRTLKKSGWWS